MAITLNGTTGITTPDLTSAAPMDVGGSAVLTAASDVLTSVSSLAAANLTGALPAIDGAALTNLPIPAAAFTLISTVTVSTSVAAIEISIPVGYAHYKLIFTNVFPATNTALIYEIQPSINNGATWITNLGTVLFGNIYNGYGAVGSWQPSGGHTLSHYTCYPAYELFYTPTDGEVMFYTPNTGVITKFIESTLAGSQSNNAPQLMKATSNFNVATGVNKIRFLSTGGNIGNGIFDLYGVSN
jgi:hypothetical protein